jgi:N-acetylneuraminic acid mutarotase
VNISGTDYLYQFGGGNSTNELRRVARLNLTTNSWQNNVTAIPYSMSTATAVAMNGDNEIYVFGGNGNTLGKTLRYNVITNTWTTMSDMPTRVTDALVVKYNSYLIYVIGGGDGYFGSGAFRTNKVQVYNTITNSYTVVDNFPINCAMQGGGIFNDTIISVGGYTDGGNATANCYKGVINPATLNVTWTQIASYPAGSITRLATYQASKDQGSGIFCTGGAINGSTPTAQSYLWNFCTQTWQNSVPNNSLARSNFKATGRGNIIYVVAGFTNTGVGITERITFNYIDGPCGITGINGNLNIPAEFNLAQNYPNPFNPSTKISFGLPKSSHVTITVSDISGRELEILTDKEYNAGMHEIQFNGSNYSSGIYLYKIQAGNYSAVKKMVLIK